MFHYFMNYSSNAHQVCYEYSPTTSLYDHCQSDNTLTFIQGHKCVSNVTTFKLTISRTTSELLHSTQRGMTLDLWMPHNYAHTRFDDFNLDARSQWVGNGLKCD